MSKRIAVSRAVVLPLAVAAALLIAGLVGRAPASAALGVSLGVVIFAAVRLDRRGRRG